MQTGSPHPDNRWSGTSHVHLPYDASVIQELSNELFELTQDGHMRFYDQEGTHDDLLWACVLGAYASRQLGGRTQLVPLKL